MDGVGRTHSFPIWPLAGSPVGLREPGFRTRSEAGARAVAAGCAPPPPASRSLGFESWLCRDSLRCPRQVLVSLGLRFLMPEVSESPECRSRAAPIPQAVTGGGAAARLPQRARPSPARSRERGRARSRSYLAAAGSEVGRAGPECPAPGPAPTPAGPIGGGGWPRVGYALGAGPAGDEEGVRGLVAGGGRAEAVAATAGPGTATQRTGGRDRADQAPQPAAAAASPLRAREHGGGRAACEGGRSGGRGAAPSVLSGCRGRRGPAPR